MDGVCQVAEVVKVRAAAIQTKWPEDVAMAPMMRWGRSHDSGSLRAHGFSGRGTPEMPRRVVDEGRKRDKGDKRR